MGYWDDWDAGEVLDQILHAIMWSPLLLIAFFPDTVWAFTVNAFWAATMREDAYHRSAKGEGFRWLITWHGKRDILFATIGGTLLGLIPWAVL